MLVHLLSLDDHVILMSIVQSVFFLLKQYGFDDLLLTVQKHKRMHLHVWKCMFVCGRVKVYAGMCMFMREVCEYGDTHKNCQKKSTFHWSDCFPLASAEGSFLLNSFRFRL